MESRITYILKNHTKESLVHIVLFVLFIWFMEAGMGTSIDDKSKNIIRMNFLALPLVFYLNSFYLIPEFLSKKRWLGYIGMLIVTVVCIEAGRSIFHVLVLNDNHDPEQLTFIEALFSKYSVSGGIFLGFLFSFAYTFTKDWLVNLSFIERLKSERSEMKLAYLKTQIDPHFLFNTLNNIYAIALKEDSQETAEAITKLGTLMRYNLEYAENDRVRLSKEIEFLKKYIELQSLRAGTKNEIEVSFDIPEDKLDEYWISPLLLIPIIENAFKYGIHPARESFISISLVLKENRIQLLSKNKIVRESEDSTKIGLKNLKERLSMIYQDKHAFHYSKKENEFLVSLEMELSA
ncbi:MAG: histidine kinase [Balneolaceae bacterium]|nr:histidine kinase [Balneolaceae bacterium]MBO6547264.1 histidine kinase [Balneolaceae bacterium]MBO6647789.1 histidine kinase [Balneolaceae bacterium]